MERRNYLVATGGTLALAGCLSDEGTDDESSAGNQDNDGSNPSQEEHDDADLEASAEVVDSDTLTAPFFSDGDGDDVPWLQIDVKNTTDVAHGELRVESRFLSTDDSVIDVRDRFTNYLPSDTTWRYYIREDFEMDELADVEHNIIDERNHVRSSEIEEATVLDSSMSTDVSSVTVTGEVDIGDADVSRVVVVALVYDEGGRFRGTVTDVESSPDATNTIAFSAGSVGYRTPNGKDQPDSCNILVLNGHP